MKIFFDGGSRPAGMEHALVVRGETIVVRDLGAGTSMDAEWRALIAAVRLAGDRGITGALLLGDAAAVIAQASGRVRCPPAYQPHRATFLAAGGGALRLRHIRRAQNLAGIALDALRR